ncbi:MAG: ErfK/YbiS/YcfS/YnhG family protein, partial [Actinoallomurus sp.]|nr:ErfK/YbiS/YcfS/YnhG family protein [Actinoallomurus sp.]
MRRGAAVATCVIAVVAGGAACGGPVPRKDATVVIVPENGTHVRPDGPVTATVRDGRIRSVILADGNRRLDGHVSPDGSRWWPRWALSPGRTYALTATVVGADGRAGTVRSAFRTRHVSRTISATVVAPQEGSTVGVGMPIVLHFAAPVQNRADVERSLEVRASAPATGAWHWFSNSDVVFRTRHYWPAHTRVRLLAHLAGLRLARGAYGAQDVGMGFQVGDSHITVASARSHHQVVQVNGLSVRWMPISMGKGTRYAYTTTSGVHLTMEKHHHVVMDSASVGCPPGCPDYYRHDVYYAVRISDSGEYEHSAPWSVADQGSHNVSHGCINMRPQDARWFFDHTQPGDIVQVTGTRRRLAPANGWGFWQLPWDEWLRDSELKTASGHGLPAPAPAGQAA